MKEVTHYSGNTNTLPIAVLCGETDPMSLCCDSIEHTTCVECLRRLVLKEKHKCERLVDYFSGVGKVIERIWLE